MTGTPICCQGAGQGAWGETTAEQIASRYEHGQCYERDGHQLIDECQAQAVKIRRQGDKTRFYFSDDSSIVDCGGVFDLGIEGCEAFCWAGEGCRCEVQS